MSDSQALDPEKVETPAQSSAGVSEQLLFKNRLQEFTQRLALPLPVYHNVNEGAQHAPQFRSSVLVEGTYYTSPNSFVHRKEAEQDAAKVALSCVQQKIKNQGSTLIREDTIFCKSILNEYAVKMSMEKPTYSTIQSKGLIPIFVSSLVFNGVTYTGDTGKNKKEAEQLAARAVIQSILDSEAGTIISEIIKSKFKLYAALSKVKVSGNTHNGSVAVEMHPGYNLGTQDNMPITAIPEPYSGQPTNMPPIPPSLHAFSRPKLESSSEAITPIVFVPPVLEQPQIFGSTSGKKRNRKSKKKAKKKVRVDDDQLPVAVVPLNQVPPFSVAQ